MRRTHAESHPPQLQPNTVLVGIQRRVWVARRLRELLGLEPAKSGLIDVSFYRDDFGAKGLHPQVKPTSILFDVEDRPIILVDDVLYRAHDPRRSTKLFDYGRPPTSKLAVLADRGGREAADLRRVLRLAGLVGDAEELVLVPADDGRLQWRCDGHA